jgi:galactokinase
VSVSPEIIARAPGRVVLIGDHTDYTGGLVCAMTIDRWTTITGIRGGDRVVLRSADESQPADVALPATDPRAARPSWARYVAAVAAERQLAPGQGFTGQVTTTIPVGSGLSSSAALEVACLLAFGGPPLDVVGIAEATQRAEHVATGLPSGILDQLTSAAGQDGQALILDCATLGVEPVAVPADVGVLVRFVAHRTLVGSPYADRVAECAAAEAVVGPLRSATLADLESIRDPLVRRRAHHVVTENQRVRTFAEALRTGDAPGAGTIMVEGHESLRRDYETSTPVMDAAVAELLAHPGVYGARMTGGGFGGCVVALTRPGVEIPGTWSVRPVAGATVNG